MHSEPVTSIGELLMRQLPSADGSTILVGPDAPVIAEWLEPHRQQSRVIAVGDPTVIASLFTAENLPTEPYDLICFIDAFRGMEKLSQSALLAQARDLSISRVLHLEVKVDSGDGDDLDQWQLPDSLSLGYRRTAVGSFGGSAWALYEYNLFNYKKTPDWLNEKHWSNPQNWDRFRW